MYEREENAPFSLISYSKERRFRVFQTLPDSWKNKKLLQVLTWFLKLVYYRDYLSKIWRNSKIHDCQPILENYRHWLLRWSVLLLLKTLSSDLHKFEITLPFSLPHLHCCPWLRNELLLTSNWGALSRRNIKCFYSQQWTKSTSKYWIQLGARRLK